MTHKSTLALLAAGSVLLLSTAALEAQEQETQPDQNTQACELGGTDQLIRAEENIKKGLKREGAQQTELFQKALQQARSQKEQARPEALWVESRALLELDSIPKGVQALQAFEELKPQCQSVANSLREQKWADVYNQGVRALQAGQPDKAQQKFALASKLQADQRSLINAGALSLQIGQLEEAEKWFRKAQKVSEGAYLQRAQRGLAQVYIQQNNQEAALELYEDMTEQATTLQGESWLEYGHLLANTGQKQQARKAYQKAGQAGSSTDVARRAGTELLRLPGKQASQAAREIYARLHQQRPFDPQVSIGLYKALLKEGELQEAVELGHQLLEAYPLHERLYTLQAQGLDRLKRARQVEQLLAQKQTIPAIVNRLQVRETPEKRWQVRGQMEGGSGLQQLHLKLVDQQGNTLAQQTVEVELSSGPAQFRATFDAHENVGGVRYSVDDDR